MPKLKTKDHDCFECGITADHAHHVVPRVLGGTKTVNLCAPCHSKVHSANLTTSALVKEGLRKRRAKGLCMAAVRLGSDTGMLRMGKFTRTSTNRRSLEAF